ncbi:alpha/beta hydrolase fold protein [Thalassoporum mexicanum PCC 7367]|uniref:alpha/beta hydrolase n=1 Tax=Thalassoporum mexicanum TaxID=3457544 RepID=UPI00029FBE54|nr:alpha/beta hydrolase [Pseudanabaena sp. PCC 7367]AFY71143.1 alpha/beta hydrolase fold protein [Pseudanabaena sp. PCC 7367]
MKKPATKMNIFSKLIFPALRVIVLAYVGLSVLLYFNQSRMVYFPREEQSDSPESLGLGYQQVELVTEDEVKLSGWYIPANANDFMGRAVVLFCHGNGGNISNRLDYIAIFNRLGFSTLMVNYRGYGESDGKPSEEGTYMDMETAWKYLTEERLIPPERILVYGESLGGGVASHIAKKYRPGGLILASTFTRLNDRAAELYPFIPIRLLSKFSYNNIDRLPEIDSPVLVIHSSDDRVIPFHHGQALYAAANEPKEFTEISGDHNAGFLDSAPTYTQAIDQFVREYMEETR